jgi:hypothetical protein
MRLTIAVSSWCPCAYPLDSLSKISKAELKLW